MKNRIRILATSDLHGYLLNEDTNTNTPDASIASLATMISSLRDENTIVIDNGDSYVGSNISFLHHMFSPNTSNPVSKAMKLMEYDYVNLGNHDFSYGEEELMLHLETLDAPCITSNLVYHGKPFAPTYVVKEFDGVKVCLFGLITQATSHLEDKNCVKNFRFKDVLDTARKTVDFIKRFEKPDYIICVYHGGFENDLETQQPVEFHKENVGYRLLREIPYLDVLITGHQHRELAGKLFKTTYVQTPSKARGLACIDIFTDTKEIEARIFPCDMEQDPEIKQIGLDAYIEDEAFLNEEIATTHVDLSIHDPLLDRLRKPQLVTCINMIQQEIMHADLSSFALPNHTEGLSKVITTHDLFETYQLKCNLVKKKITGKVLKDYLEKCAEFFCIEHEYITISPDYQIPRKKYYNYDFVDGVSYKINVKRDRGSRIYDLMYQGKPVEDDQEFTIALSARRANGAGGYKMLQNCPTLETSDLPAVELIRRYLKEKKVIDFEAIDNIQVVKE